MKKLKEGCFMCYPNESEVLWETTHSRVMINIDQVNGTYAVMVVPKVHLSNIGELFRNYREAYHDLWVTVGDVVTRFEENGEFLQGNILYNKGYDAGQRIEHLHVHVITRQKDDNMIALQRPTRRKITDQEISAIKLILNV